VKLQFHGLSQFCTENTITILPRSHVSAFDILALGSFDFVFWKMILHHREPFEDFSDILRRSMADGGKAFFHENSAFSDLLIWFRNNVVGKYGIAKYGDDDEFPLTPKEVESLRQNFSVNVVHPELVFFSLASIYLLKGHLHRFF
jgi:hypothetical protein